MKKYKTKIIIAIVVLAAIAGSWFLGGAPDINVPNSPVLAAEAVETPTPDNEPDSANVPAQFTDNLEASGHEEHVEYADENVNENAQEIEDESETQSDSNSNEEDEPETQSESDSNSDSNSNEEDESETQSESESDSNEEDEPETQSESDSDSNPDSNEEDEPETQSESDSEEESGQGNGNGLDIQILGEYHPEMRTPVEPEDMVATDESFTVFLEVRVDMILHNMHLLHRDKHELVPADGVIFPRTEVTAYAGESVFNVLQREMRRNRIHMASRFTPMFNSAYVEAINNLYEFDVGSLSGWMYSVNGWFPNFGSSRYLLNPGDEIRWEYTVDLGRDLGVTWIEGGQGN